jgi:hypothetical protein
LFTVGCPHLKKFQHFCGTVGLPYGVVLPVPNVVGDSDEARLSFLKKFCGDFLEEPVTHMWHVHTKGLQLRQRFSIRMSLFLYRKALPSLAPAIRPYLEKMSKPSPVPDSGFMEYVRKRVPQLFPYGWDSGSYESACLNSTVPVKSCIQRGAGVGGSRLEVIERHGGSTAHHDFVLRLLSEENPISLLPSRCGAVETGGKQRIVSTGDVEMNLFRPLHSAIYNQLSKHSWLLRGDAKPSRFKKEFTLKAGEVFTSGDYESATDNLNSEVQETILSLILDNTTSVPKGIRDSACSTLRMRMCSKEVPDTVFYQHRGQLMGNLLSFPLLCLVNYLAFRYYSRSSGDPSKENFVPVRVNGDDIIFRSTPEVSDRWVKGVVGSGLVLSKGKTMVHRTFFSLNSSLFYATKLDVFLVPVIRSTAFGYSSKEGSVESLAGRWKGSFPGFYGHRLSVLRVAWLKFNRKWIVASRRSLTRGLGLNVRESEVRDAGLWGRECFYLSMAMETPLPVKRSTLDQVMRIPNDWSPRRVDKITKEMREKMRGIAGAFVECAWSEVRGIFDDSDYRDRVDMAPNWLGDQRDSRRQSRLLKISIANSRRFLKPRIDRELSSYWKAVRFTIWEPTVAIQEVNNVEAAATGRWQRPMVFAS